MRTEPRRDNGGGVGAGWIAALACAALLLRAVGLDSGLWIDEIYSLVDSFRPALTQIVTVFPRDNQHPLYSVLAHIAIAAFGEAPWVIRLPALLFGVASVPLLYALGLQVTDRREALLAAALLTVSYHHVWFSQNARGYTALAFFALLSTWLLLRNLERPSAGTLVAYSVAAALGAYTHLTMVFVLAGHALVMAGRNLWRDGDGRRWRDGTWPWIGLALAGLLILLCYAPILTQVQQFFLHRPSALKGVSTPSWAAGEAIKGLMVGLGAGTGTLAATVVAAAALLFGAGLASYARRAPLALALFVAPGVAMLFGAVVVRGTLYPRFFFALIGFGLLIGVGEPRRRSLGRPPPRRPCGAQRHAADWHRGDRTAALALRRLAGLQLPLPEAGFRRRPRLGGGPPGAGRAGGDRRCHAFSLCPMAADALDGGGNACRTGGAARAGTTSVARLHAAAIPRVRHARPVAGHRDDCRPARVFPGTLSGGDIVACTFPPTQATSPAREAR